MIEFTRDELETLKRLVADNRRKALDARDKFQLVTQSYADLQARAEHYDAIYVKLLREAQ